MSFISSLSKIRELRLVMCQMSSQSAGVRSFVDNHYAAVKAAHPDFLFIVRECSNAIPTITARYDYGVEKRIFAEDLSDKDVEGKVLELVKEAEKINSTRA